MSSHTVGTDELSELTDRALNVAERRRAMFERIAETRRKMRDLAEVIEAQETSLQDGVGGGGAVTPVTCTLCSSPAEATEHAATHVGSISVVRTEGDSAASEHVRKPERPQLHPRAALPQLRGQYSSRAALRRTADTAVVAD
eukprot:TRINITY_DN49216_c0_g1_i1.p1 TRINITY_DN49216_c0_g1~~TRINITY_DN49216_c0_g1_i1.p1  ORF type:complete len:142 (+),score=20.51 TRINITY_DN49216_c0_g1_i1:93-518(+)